MKLHEHWRQEYNQDSYLSHLSHADLSFRAKYLIENLTSLELNGKIGLRDINREPAHTLMRKFTHVLQELVIRKRDPEKRFLKGASVPEAMLGQEAKLIKLNEHVCRKRPHLIKFGKCEYFEKSSFKVSLASSFSDPSLNTAQMDDEMKAIYYPHPKDITVSTQDGNVIDGIKNVKITYEIPNDYYIFCSSLFFDVRLFGDFEADACLLIFDSKNFSNDLFNQVAKKIEVTNHGNKQVTYVDPIRPDHGKPPPIEFHKHIRYLYQNEFRHVFVSSKEVGNPSDLFVHIPEVDKYSEIVCL